MSNIQLLRNKLEQQKGQKQQIVKSLAGLKEELKQAQKDLRRHEQAREVIREVGLKTEQQLQYDISDIASLALDAVFNNPYELKVEFVQRRNKTECDLFFTRDDNDIEPEEGAGVGAMDITSFALRIASWSMLIPHTRNVIILDEPFKHLSVDLQDRASAMIKEISKKVGLQFIIITHDPTLASYADKVFEVRIKKGISQLNGF